MIGRAVLLGRLVVIVLFLVCGIAVPVASAQAQKPRTALAAPTGIWEIEFRMGFGLSGSADVKAGGAMPPAGESFTTAGGSPTRRVSSWAFGDGAKLLNDVLQSFGRAERIVPLDAVLTTPGIDQTTDTIAFGVRVARSLSPRLAVEGDFEFARTSYAIPGSTRSGLETSSDSFVSAFGGLVASGQGVAFLNPSLTSTVTSANGDGVEMLATGALIMNFGRPGRLMPYVAAGGGVALAAGGASASVSSRYTFQLPSGARVDERDEVRIHFGGGLGLVVLAGGGVKVRLSRNSGVRADARIHLIQNHADTRIDTRPDVAQSTPADAIWSSLTPGIQFSTHSSTNLDSNLSAPALSGFRTMGAAGFESRFSLSAGYFFRF